MPDANLLRSITYLMDCFVSDYNDEDVVKQLDEISIRAQIEVVEIIHCY